MAVKRALSLVLALCLASLDTSSASTLPTKRDAVVACLESASVPHAVKGTSEWTLDVTPYNLRLPYKPAAVAIPTSVRQVASAVRCGTKNGLRVSAKAGGHGYGSFALGGEDGHLVVVLDRMESVTLHRDGKTATVQPGARLGHVAVELYDQGKRAIAHGSCPG